MVEPLRIRVGEERHAVALAYELEGVAPIEVTRNSDAWEISLDGLQTSDLLVSTLEAIRRSLSGQPSVTAEVVLDGDTYQMHGE
jgi:hypothetical protein